MHSFKGATLMTVAELVSKFLLHKQRNGCRPATLKHYTGRLKKFVARFGTMAPAEVGREEVLTYLFEVGQGLSSSTRRSDIVVLEILQAYAIDFDHLVAPWIRKKDAPKPPQGIRQRIPTLEETVKLLTLAQAKRPDFAVAYRFLRLSGARPGELCGAEITQLQVNGDARVLVLPEHKTSRKTGLPRRIPIGVQLAPLVDQAIAGRRAGRIFLDRRGEPWDRDGLSRLFRTFRDELGLDKDLVLYCTRHEFGTAVAHEFGILEASRLLGHSNVAMTQRYAKTPEDQLRDVQGRAIKDVDPGQAGQAAA